MYGYFTCTLFTPSIYMQNTSVELTLVSFLGTVIMVSPFRGMLGLFAFRSHLKQCVSTFGNLLFKLNIIPEHVFIFQTVYDTP